MQKNNVPMRRCIACGASLPKKELLRIVISEGVQTADPTGRKNGRGAYLCKNQNCYGLAKKKRLISDELYQELMKE
ncbi:MAG: YlxR family protein [Eubacterium sp.]|nr:YlxR family protein [Eubacterium sp.]